MPNCIGNLCEHKLNTFEFIISHQYRKFILFYDLLKSFNDYIDKFCYIFMNQDVLCVDVTFDESIKPVDVLKDIQSSIKLINDEIIISCEVDDDRLTLKIDMTEVDGYTEEEIKQKEEHLDIKQ